MPKFIIHDLQGCSVRKTDKNTFLQGYILPTQLNIILHLFAKVIL